MWVFPLVLVMGLPLACTAGAPPEASKVPAEFKSGETKFNANCAKCHGDRGVGTAQGPPLVNKIYEPSHHGDAAFQFAAAKGVRAHHWKFGDMPKIEGVSSEDVTQITAYVRWLQRQAGIQ
jgi:mono/diheme cytochrome c family protein